MPINQKVKKEEPSNKEEIPDFIEKNSISLILLFSFTIFMDKIFFS